MTHPIDHQIIAGTSLRLIEDEQRWAKGAVARTVEGDACAWNDPRAVRFCAAGALVRVAADLRGDEARVRRFAVKVGCQVTAAAHRRGAGSPFNDDCEGQAAVVLMFTQDLT